MKATEPIGSGWRIKPRIVVTKMAKRCQAWTLSPAGTGVNQIAAPTKTTSKARMRSLFIRLLITLDHGKRYRQVRSKPLGCVNRHGSWSLPTYFIRNLAIASSSTSTPSPIASGTLTMPFLMVTGSLSMLSARLLGFTSHSRKTGRGNTHQL